LAWNTLDVAAGGVLIRGFAAIAVAACIFGPKIVALGQLKVRAQEK